MGEDIHILNSEEITEKLKEIPGWEFKDDKISKEFKFKYFLDVLDFIMKLAPICEEKDHHPNIHIFYNRILFELNRFDVGGKVTNADFEIAKEIERLYSGR
ncbi:MAG: 4a-hydroxytetrahydrobiopterin dehydratase [Nanoarchaeota archaeon]|nr:4a-hydroxytetrahydrobiopterin dehydratase [Nanoarchaeota archaeon]